MAPNETVTINCRVLVCLEEHLLEHGEELHQRTGEVAVHFPTCLKCISYNLFKDTAETCIWGCE